MFYLQKTNTIWVVVTGHLSKIKRGLEVSMSLHVLMKYLGNCFLLFYLQSEQVCLEISISIPKILEGLV